MSLKHFLTVHSLHMMNISSEFKDFLSSPKKICLINHWNPDGDAVGSTYGLGEILHKMGHEVAIIMPNAFPTFLNFLSTSVNVVIYEEDNGQADLLLKNCDLIGTLDFNNVDRCGSGLQKHLESTEKKIFMLDHHREPGDYADFTFSFPSVASTCELVYELAEDLQALDHLDANACQALYTGIMTDTGSFRFPSVRPKTLEIAGDLIRRGAQPHLIHEQIFDQDRESRLKLLGNCLSGMIVRKDIGAVFMSLDLKTLETLGFSKGDTEGFVNYGLSMAGIRVSVFAIERKEGWKISFRSKGDVDVSAISREHFNGGGHFNAAGGMHEGDDKVIMETVWKILSA